MFFNDSAWTPLVGTNSLALAIDGANNASASGTGTGGNYSALATAIGDQLNFVNAPGVMDLVINNLDDGDHPFHLHGHTFWILSQARNHFYGDTGGLNTTNPLRRDTVMIQNLGHAVIRFRTDNPGVWAFHCHIGWHMESGLLLTVTDDPGGIKGLEVPRDVAGLCADEERWRQTVGL
jgi:FtsP/CotA-like multicopper oxidase with cupredoxin domain